MYYSDIYLERLRETTLIVRIADGQYDKNVVTGAAVMSTSAQ